MSSLTASLPCRVVHHKQLPFTVQWLMLHNMRIAPDWVSMVCLVLAIGGCSHQAKPIIIPSRAQKSARRDWHPALPFGPGPG